MTQLRLLFGSTTAAANLWYTALVDSIQPTSAPSWHHYPTHLLNSIMGDSKRILNSSPIDLFELRHVLPLIILSRLILNIEYPDTFLPSTYFLDPATGSRWMRDLDLSTPFLASSSSWTDVDLVRRRGSASRSSRLRVFGRKR